MRLEGKVAVITGAGSGFGEGMAKRFAEEGAKIVAADINGAEAGRVASEIGSAAVAITVDVSSPEQTNAMIAKATDSFGRLDILVNNAGYSNRAAPLHEVSEEDFDRIFAVNAKAIYLSARAAVPLMTEQGGGVILNTASTAGLRPRPNLAWYNSSKGWAITATKSMAVELAPQNIRVNCLCPVAGETGMLGLFLGEDTPERRQVFKDTIPMGRLSTPLDIANAALFLVSDEAEFLTGLAMEVDGGRCI